MAVDLWKMGFRPGNATLVSLARQLSILFMELYRKEKLNSHVNPFNSSDLPHPSCMHEKLGNISEAIRTLPDLGL